MVEADFQRVGERRVGADGLPHSPHFAAESEFSDLGHLLHALIEEGKTVAAAAGIELHEDPWEMNKIGAMTNHPPSMLSDTAQVADRGRFSERRDRTRSSAGAGSCASAYCDLPAYQGKEAGWTFKDENRPVVAHEKAGAH